MAEKIPTMLLKAKHQVQDGDSPLWPRWKEMTGKIPRPSNTPRSQAPTTELSFIIAIIDYIII